MTDATTSDPFQDMEDNDNDNNTEMEETVPPETAQIDMYLLRLYLSARRVCLIWRLTLHFIVMAT